MSFLGGGKKDNSGAIARAEEAARQARIKEGTTKIGDIFSQFNDDFFGGVSQASLDFFNPQLQDQFNEERRNLTLALSRTGNLASSAGARKIGELTKLFKKQQAFVGSNARDSVLRARSDVENARGDLLAQLNAAADPSAAGISATARAGILSAPPVFSPLQNVFTGFANQVTTGLLARNAGFKNPATDLFNFSKKSGSSRIIN